ncbi:MAG: nucleotidyl transferase AbiEii/AbiGii toxin family protein, partial [Candidatus Omnitrophota bacterium]
MLTYEALIEQAKAREMPVTKIRGILREYLQFLILKELYNNKYGKKLYFTGGTYLRVVHNIKRFSEDLDFNTDKITKKEFELLLETIKNELKRTGIECKVRFSHRGRIYISSLIFPAIEELYKAKSKYSRKEGIVIKVETNNPKWKIKRETPVISGFGEIYPIICTEIGALFADKIDALLKKNRGRHLYDLIFMLSNKYP